MHFWLSLYSFSVAFLPTLLGPIFFPFLKINFFAPYLVLLLYKKTFIQTLWQALAFGFVIDLLASNTPFGFWTMNYLVSIYLLSYLKPFFFEDKFLTLPILTSLFSISSTLIYLFSTHLFFHQIHFEFKWALTDLFVYPLLDSLFCLLIFNIPLHYLSLLLPEKRRVVQSFKMNRDK